MNRRTWNRVHGGQTLVPSLVDDRTLLAVSDAACALTGELVTAQPTESGAIRLSAPPSALDSLARGLGFRRVPGLTLVVTRGQGQRLIAQRGVGRALQTVSDAAITPSAPDESATNLVELLDEEDALQARRRRAGGK